MGRWKARWIWASIDRPSWLPGAGTLGSLLEEIQGQADANIGEMFHVHEGIKTGAKRIFLQPPSVVRALPDFEQRYFKEAVEGDNFSNGEIRPNAFLFLADEAWETEGDVQKAVPRFFERYLKHATPTMHCRGGDARTPGCPLSRNLPPRSGVFSSSMDSLAPLRSIVTRPAEPFKSTQVNAFESVASRAPGS